MSKSKPVYLTTEQAESLYKLLWSSIGTKGEDVDIDTRAVKLCLRVAVRAKIVRAFPKLADTRIEGEKPAQPEEARARGGQQS